MEVHAQLVPPGEVQADWLIVTAWEDAPPEGAVADLDGLLDGALGRLREAGDVTGKANELTPLLDVRRAAARRVLVVGLGKRSAADGAALTAAAAAAARSVTGKQTDRLAF